MGWMRRRNMSAAEVIEQDVLRLHTQVLKHLDDRGVHHRRSTHVVLAILRSRMILEVVLVEHVMDEAGRAGPVVLRQRIGQCQMPLEVLMLGGQLVVLLDVEGLAQGAGAVPEGDLALGLDAQQLIHDVRAHRRHAGTTTDEHHLRVGILGEELTEGTVYGDLVTRLQAEHIGRHDARRDIVAPGRRRGHADVELDDALLFRIVGHRIGADHRLVYLGYVAPDIELVPIRVEFRLDVEILVVNGVRRALQLDVAAGTEVHVLAFGQTQGQLLDEGRHVRVGLYSAFPLLDPEDLLRNPDLHVLLDRCLARQTPALAGLALVDVGLLVGQHLAAAAFHYALALGAGSTTAAGGGQENAIVSQGAQQLATGRNGNGLLPVDLDVHIATGNQTRARKQNHYHQCQHDAGEHRDG